MKNKFVFLLLSASLLLTACGSSTKTGDKTRKDASSKVEQSQSSSKDDSKKAIKDGKMVPYDHVNKFKNTKSSKGVLDKNGIYRYDFLKKDDTVYDAMTYQEVQNIFPVHEQKKVNVTLATNFTIDGHNFNFKDLTVNKLANILTGEDYEQNTRKAFGLHTHHARITLPNSPIVVELLAINKNKREDIEGNSLIMGMKISRVLSNPKPKAVIDLGDRITYEGINFNITRNQFLEKVKIQNPILKEDDSLRNKDYKRGSSSHITYMIQKKNPKIEDSADSVVNFYFKDEILSSVRVYIDPTQLGIEEFIKETAEQF